MLSDIQERIERSIYERIRITLTQEGYWPDITLYPNTPQGYDAFNQGVKNIEQTKGFSIEPFGHGSSRKKYEKRCPRIVIISRRIVEGELGNPMNPLSIPDPNDPNNYIEIVKPQESSNLQIDVRIASGGEEVAKQDRVMNAIVHRALVGTKGFMPYYDDPTQLFFLKQYNYYDLPDAIAGIEEKVYSFQVDDLYLISEEDQITNPNISPIREIEIELNTPNSNDSDHFTIR